MRAITQLRVVKSDRLGAKIMTEGLVLGGGGCVVYDYFPASELMSLSPGGTSGDYFAAFVHEIPSQRHIVIK